MSTVTDRIRRDLKDDIYYQQNYANDGERFLAWYLRNVYLRTPIQARKDITDGADDKQIDAVDPIILMAANCFNSALDTVLAEYAEKGKVPSVPNWLKSKDSVLKIQASVRMYLGMLPNMPGGKELKQKLVVPPERFGLRWVAE